MVKISSDTDSGRDLKGLVMFNTEIKRSLFRLYGRGSLGGSAVESATVRDCLWELGAVVRRSLRGW